MNPTIGISGVATSGKDTFGKLLIQELEDLGYAPRRFALADSLKRDLAPFIKEEYGIDVFNCTLEEKTLIRPFLVFHGEMKRLQSNGTYWLDRVDKEIEETVKTLPNLIPIITDVRYAYYPNDEMFWIKQKRHGLVVHVERFSYALDESGAETKNLILPANEVEAKHDGALRTQADYTVTWPTCPIDKGPIKKPFSLSEWCSPYVEAFCHSQQMKDFLKRCHYPRPSPCGPRPRMITD